MFPSGSDRKGWLDEGSGCVAFWTYYAARMVLKHTSYQRVYKPQPAPDNQTQVELCHVSPDGLWWSARLELSRLLWSVRLELFKDTGTVVVYKS